MITQFQISIVVALLILIFPYFFRRKLEKSQVAGIVLSLGITGTFVGVFIGLYNFDESDLTSSVPLLLAGLKTAFITSIAGLIANILLKLVPSIYGYEKEINDDEANNVGRDLTAAIQQLTFSVSGDGETTLITQLQKLRTTNHDGFTQMHDSFEDFAEKMVADSTQSLIDSLTKVMEDFNAKINEQFGENFKQLNAAVGAMVTWQDKHKDMVERQHDEYKDVIDQTRLKYDEQYENQSKQFNEQFESQSNIIKEQSKTQLDEFKKQYQEQTNLISSVQRAISLIKSDFSVMQTQSSTFQTTSDKLYETLNDFNIGVSRFAELGDKAKSSLPLIEQNLNSITETTNNFVRNNLSDLQSNYEQFAQSQKDILSRTKREVESMITDNKDRIENLDKALEDELNKALENLGSNLSSLSNQFVNDYQPLTQQLRRVVELAKNLED
ncbi:MAG: hypothetical protein ACJA2S_002282 [Cyclobacteriaceae bacterium]|jgi:hypothetical protein